MMKKIEPIADRVAILPGPQETEYEGVLLPETVRRKPNTGTVVAVGLTQQIKENDNVLFPAGTGTEVTVGKDKLIVMREVDVICILKNQNK